MSLNAGVIVVDSGGNATGTGLAIDMFNNALGSLDAPTKARVAAAMAPFFQGLSAAIVNHLVANAVVDVVVRTTDGGLQLLPSSLVAGTPTSPPAGNKHITGVLT